MCRSDKMIRDEPALSIISQAAECVHRLIKSRLSLYHYQMVCLIMCHSFCCRLCVYRLSQIHV